ncbi:hypothetical protein F5B21DRAFT_479945 [Xylaria acuta]|nr:hypothetical protein F5B21DRAFT_479945 [Xylaria acuta]
MNSKNRRETEQTSTPSQEAEQGCTPSQETEPISAPNWKIEQSSASTQEAENISAPAQGAGRISTPSQEAVNSAARLYNTIQALFPTAVTEFRSRWAAAQAVCRSPSTSTRDDACIRTNELDVLYRLGPKSIPFVVSKLASDTAGRDLWAVFLYNALQDDPNYRPNLLVDEDLRRRSTAIVELNYERNGIAEERVEVWKEHHR